MTEISTAGSRTGAARKVALITGAAQRIGEQLARALHARDYNVLIHYRYSAGSAQKIVAELNALRDGSAAALPADMENIESVRALAEQAQSQWGRIDALINNASSYYATPWQSATPQDWDSLFGSNLKGPFFLTQALLPELARNKGSVLNIVDIFAERPSHDFPLYCMAKAGLAMMTKSLAFDWGHSLRVNAIAPGAILWPEPPLDDDAKQRMLEKIPAGQIGDPADIVRTALFLLDDASYVNGQIIAVDGGLSLHT